MAKTPQLLLVGAALLLGATAHAGKLDDARSEVSGGGSSSSGSSGSSNSDDSGGSGGGITLPPIMACVTPIGAAYCIPHLVLEEEPGVWTRPEAFFLRYPYQGDTGGHMTFLEGEADPKPPGAAGVSFRIAARYAYDWDGLHLPGVDALLETTLPMRLGVETGWTTYIEPLPGMLDHLTIGDLNLTIRFAQSRRVEFRSGLGARLMIDRGDVAGGFNFTYGFDVYPARPVVVSASIDLGNLGRAFYLEGKGTLGMALRGMEIFAGYDATRIGDVVLHGPVAGIRGWF